MEILFVASFIGGWLVAWYLDKKKKSTIKNNISNTKINGGFVGGNRQSQKVGKNSFDIQGNNICINGGKIIVDGVVIAEDLGNSPITVTVEGDCHDLTTTNGSVDVLGSVTNNIKTTNGDVDIHDYIGGNVTTGNGDVECGGNIKGNVSTKLGDITSYGKD